MPAPKGNQNAKGNRGGRPTLYKPAYAAQAAKACQAGFTDQELADLFGVAVSTISAWKAEHVEFSDALKPGFPRWIGTLSAWCADLGRHVSILGQRR
jgi:hypothetical protein